MAPDLSMHSVFSAGSYPEEYWDNHDTKDTISCEPTAQESNAVRHGGLLSSMEAFQSLRNILLAVLFTISRMATASSARSRFALIARDEARTHATPEEPCSPTPDRRDPSIRFIHPPIDSTTHPSRPLTSSELSGTSDPTLISPVQLPPLLVQCLFEPRGYGVYHLHSMYTYHENFQCPLTTSEY